MKKYILLTLVFVAMHTTSAFAQDIMLLKTSGKVVIGDTSLISTPGAYNLYVQNGILTEKVKVALRDASEWSDDAFAQTPTLSEVETSINKNNHLPGVPSAQSLVKNGYELKSMDAKLLAQIEWLWQHTIKLDVENKKLKQEIAEIKSLMETSSPKHD
jgi:hypothetical protein